MGASGQKTQILIEELNHPSIQRQKAKKNTVEKGESTFTTVHLPTPLGEITYGHTDVGADDSMTVALLTPGGKLVDKPESIPPGIKKQLPEKYHSVPSNVYPQIVVGESTEPELVRHATKSEKEALAEITDIPAEDQLAVIGSDENKFHVYDGTGARDKGILTISVSSSDAGIREVNSEELQNAQIESNSLQINAESVEASDVCWGKCLICVESTAFCIDCIVVCTTSLAIWPLMIACITCLVLNCGSSPLSCNECLECAPDKYT